MDVHRTIPFLFLILSVSIDLSTSAILEEGDACQTPSKTNGTCIDLRNCEDLRDLVKKPQNFAKNLTFLKQSTCGYKGINPLVCCPTKLNNRFEADITTHPNYNLLPNKCGDNEEDRIFGGEKTGIYEFPWMALLSYKEDGKDNSQPNFLCGGSVISQRYILTAAHCVMGLKNKVLDFVRVGEHDLRTNPDCDGYGTCIEYKDFAVEEVVHHPSYNRQILHHDIAIIRVQTPIDLINLAIPVCLPMTESKIKFDFSKQNGTVTGWGKTENSSRSEVLLKIQVPVINNTACNAIFKTTLKAGIIDSQLCAGGLSMVDSCSGDSGGPIMFTDPGNSNFIQYGVVSFGPQRCGSTGRPAVYTRVTSYMTWILDQIKP